MPRPASRTRAWSCWRSRGAATATSRTGSRSRAGASRRATTEPIRATLKGRCRTRRCSPALGDCYALLIPEAAQGRERIAAHAVWLKDWFQERCAIAIELLHRADDDDLVDHVTHAARFAGLPIAAAGDVLMHVRSRKPLQDTLAATRLARPVAECGFALAPNAEQHLRSRSRLAALYEPAWLAQTMAIAESCVFTLAELKYEYPQEIVPPGETPASQLRKLDLSPAR